MRGSNRRPVRQKRSASLQAVALCAIGILAVSACSESSTDASPGGTGGGSAAAGAAKATCHTNNPPERGKDLAPGADPAAAVAARTKPAVVVPKNPTNRLISSEMIIGTGDAVGPGSTVTVHYVGVQQSDCKEFDSSWNRKEPATFGLDQVITGWRTGLVGMKPGGRRYLVIPAKQAYGDKKTDGRPAGTLVFVVDMISAKAPVAADPQALIDATTRGVPKVVVPSPLPATLTTVDEVVGRGTTVAPGMTVVAHYVGVDAQGNQFDSSWRNGDPAKFSLDQVIPGWSEGLVGMKVGGRRTLVIPADKAYGNTPVAGRPAGTLIFVVDLVGAG